MPKDKTLNVKDRRQMKAAELQLFVKATGRKKRRGGLDPNDRNVDRQTAVAVRRMSPNQFDELLRGEDDDPIKPARVSKIPPRPGD